MFLRNDSIPLPLCVLIVFLAGQTSLHADGGISSAGGFVEIAYYIALVVASLPLGIAIAIRKKRAIPNWLMIGLISPSVIFSFLSLFFSLVALFFATITDVRMGTIFGIVGIAQILIIQRLYVSYGKYHQTET
jgi:hypothetical protein